MTISPGSSARSRKPEEVATFRIGFSAGALRIDSRPPLPRCGERIQVRVRKSRMSPAVTAQTASVSLLQRRLRVGYTRAGRLIDMLERRGVISGYEGSKPRQVLISQADVSRVLASGASRDEEPVPTASTDE